MFVIVAAIAVCALRPAPGAFLNVHLHPSQILQQAYAHTLSAHSPLSTRSFRASRPSFENYAAGCIPSTSSSTKDTELSLLHIAHLGDSMAMLIRGGRIVWRTAEMWRSYSHPLQLAPGPSCPQPHTTPSRSTQTTSSSSPLMCYEPATPSPILSFLHSTLPIQILLWFRWKPSYHCSDDTVILPC